MTGNLMDADQQKLFDIFTALEIETKTCDHEPAYTVDDAQRLRGEISGGHCKNLFLKDKKAVLWLVVCLEDTNVDLKSLPKSIGSARLSFGKPDLLLETLGVEPGSVTPFALINDSENRVNVILQKSMLGHEIVNFHPLRNTQTTSIASADLVKFVRACGHEPLIMEL